MRTLVSWKGSMAGCDKGCSALAAARASTPRPAMIFRMPRVRWNFSSTDQSPENRLRISGCSG